MIRRYTVLGMMCSACSLSVERVVKKIDGVNDAVVNLMAKTLVVEVANEVEDDTIIQAIERAGFEAFVKGEDKGVSTSLNIGRLIASIVLTVILSCLAMANMIGIPLPDAFHTVDTGYLYALAQMILAIPVLILNRRFFVGGYKAVRRGSPDMDTLITVGSGASFLFGVFSLGMLIFASVTGSEVVYESYIHNLYFESSAMILTLVSVGKTLEERAKVRTGSAVDSLKKLAPTTAIVYRDGEEREIDVALVRVGDILRVREGTSLAVDGIIVEGEGIFDESSLTGESMPVLKRVSDEVSSATICREGSVLVEVRAIGDDTMLGQMISYVENAELTRAPIAKLADKISGIFVPIVMGISLVTLIVWLAIGVGFDEALSYAISVLVVSCPCALGLATPVAVTVAMGRYAKGGILVKSAETIENIGKIRVAIFDKTGTITEGKVRVTRVEGLDDKDIVGIASIENNSAHPIAKAIVEYSGISEFASVVEYSSTIGRGVEGIVDEVHYKIGNRGYFDDMDLPELDGLYVVRDGVYIGSIEVADTLRADAIDSIRALKGMGIKTVLLSGDNRRVCQKVASECGFDEYVAEVLPDQKLEVVSRYQNGDIVAFTGDGINDSLALSKADVGIAVSTGADVAINSADVVLISDKLSTVVRAIRTGKRSLRIIKQNLFWAFFYNVLMIPIAAGVLAPLGLSLSPMIASASMSISSLIVVTNALRINKEK